MLQHALSLANDTVMATLKKIEEKSKKLNMPEELFDTSIIPDAATIPYAAAAPVEEKFDMPVVRNVELC